MDPLRLLDSHGAKTLKKKKQTGWHVLPNMTV